MPTTVEFKYGKGRFEYDENTLNRIVSELGKWAGRHGTIIIEYDNNHATINYTERELASIIEEESGGEYTTDDLTGVRAYAEYGASIVEHYARIMINSRYLKNVGEFAKGLLNILLGKPDAFLIASGLVTLFERHIGPRVSIEADLDEDSVRVWVSLIYRGP